MPINSREKGKRFERDLAKRLREHGYTDCRRGQQYSGGNGDADVVNLPYIHIEAKAREQMSLYNWMSQAKADAKDGLIPVVFHKKNNHKILVTLEFDDFMEIYKEYESSMTLRDLEAKDYKERIHPYEEFDEGI